MVIEVIAKQMEIEMPIIMEIDRTLSPEERKAARATIERNGLDYYARFQDGEAGRAAAQKLAAKIERATGIRMTVGESYSVRLGVF